MTRKAWIEYNEEKAKRYVQTGAANVNDQGRRPPDRAFAVHHSKYLNGGNVREENRLAIDAAVAELGFSVNVFARSLKANRSMTVGVLLPTISSPFLAAWSRRWS